MFVLIFLVILSILVFVHELGHFLVAKIAGVKVEEFGFGYPPKAVKLFRKWDTDFTLNWIPFGGFVKIVGENYVESDEPEVGLKVSPKSDFGLRFSDASKVWQILILAAGVVFNIVFAWILFSATFLIGTPYPADAKYGNQLGNLEIMVTNLSSDFPAEKAGIKTGDLILDVSRGNVHAESANEELTIEAVSQFIGESDQPVNIEVQRGGKDLAFTLRPAFNQDAGRYIIGIGMDRVGILRLPLFKALGEGARNTRDILSGTFAGVWHLLADSFRGKNDLSQVAGPVGIVGLVKDATLLGFVYLLSFTGFISINLAVVNLIPFPALDGGRIVMVIVEAIKRSPVNPKIYNWLNTIGFFLLIGLMIIITFHDIVKLF